MARVVQKLGTKGSLKWMQRAVNEKWNSLEQPILSCVGNAQELQWRSPLIDDDYAEYRDGAFLDQVGLAHLKPQLSKFWPERGPQWDALGITNAGHVLLIEAKAHIAEMCSPGTAAKGRSLEHITECLDICAERLGARPGRAPWTEHFYQLANRIAHLQFLRDCGVDARLVLVNLLNDAEMDGPKTMEAWQAAYDVALHVMGLGKRHSLSRHIIEVFLDVTKPGRTTGDKK